MNDPYQILGVSRNATDDEVKQAYRSLAKKYHPDANPGDRVAEQRMKEINAAYDQIMNKQADPHQQAGYGGYGGYGGYEAYGGYGSGASYHTEAPTMTAVCNFLTYGRYREALTALSGIPAAERTARWYYYSAMANQGLGNRMEALQNAERACRMDPGNEEYALLLEQLQNPGRVYTAYGRSYGAPSFNLNNVCLSFCLAQLLCRFCYC